MLFLKENKGYTLTELIIAIMIGSILVAGASATYISQNRSYVAQESVSEINTQAKIAQDLISNDLRSAGFAAPTNLNQDPINGFTTIITPIDNNNSPDAVTVVGGFKMIGTMWPPGAGPGVACPSVVPLGSTQIRIIYSGTDSPDITDNRFMSIDGIDFVQVQNCTLSGGGCDANTITLDRPLTQDFPLLDTDGNGLCDAGRPVYLIEDATYCVDNNLILRRIRRNANPNTCTSIASSEDDAIAENIEDLQLAYAIDANSDGQIDDQNGNGNIDAGDFLNGAVIADPSIIKALRINILARSDKPDPNYLGLGNPPAIIENRNHNPLNDNFRRRLWQSIITMRNQ